MTQPKAGPSSSIRGRSQFLPVMLPFIEDDDVRAVGDVLRSGWLTVGQRCLDFEKALKPWTGSQYIHVVSSGTAAIELALKSLGIGAGDAVVTTPITFTATVASILHCGARPILADVEPDTINIDPAQIERILHKEKKVRAILPVHFAGHPCEMDPILELARKRHLLVVEDAAHAFPAQYKGRSVGSLGDVTCFSFFACKNLCGIEGGAIATDRAAVDRRVRRLSLHGISRDAWKRYGKGGSWKYDVAELGYKNNFTDVQAALGLAQLAKLDRMQARREAIVEIYNEAFARVEALEIPAVRDHVKPAWHIYVLRLKRGDLKIDRDRLIDLLRVRNIGTSMHFIPIHLHSLYKKILKQPAKAYPNAMDYFSRALTLPLHPGMSDQDAHDVVGAVQEIVHQFRA